MPKIYAAIIENISQNKCSPINSIIFHFADNILSKKDAILTPAHVPNKHAAVTVASMNQGLIYMINPPFADFPLLIPLKIDIFL